jgi:peptide/nickel transport system permease protein/oligopeptide transport system permease protein
MNSHAGLSRVEPAGGPEAPTPVESESVAPARQAWRRFARNRVAAGSALFLGAFVLLLVVWPWFSSSGLRPFLPRALTHSPTALSEAQFAPPSRQHWFGTDVHGRDQLSRALYGARISLLVGAVGAGVSLVIGVLWGATAGYLGGRWDAALMRVVDILYSLPSIVFVIVLITTLEVLIRGWLGTWLGVESASTVRLLFLFAGLGAVSWLTMARIVRGQVLSLRGRPFIDASRALGAGPIRILLRHILPNITGVVIVYATLTVPSIVLYESFLSYLGLGIQPPHASLGSLIAEGAAQINPIRIYWWTVVFPGLVLVLALLSLNFVGDGLRDAFDTRSRRD